MHRRLLIVYLTFIGTQVSGQIAAEAQGGKLTLWAAIGFDQAISKNWVSVTDIGYGRHSDPDNFNLLKRQGLNVITEDLIYKHGRWRFAFSFGYWKRYAYEENSPYDMRMKPYEYRNELRPFLRAYYNHDIKRIKVTHILRSDYRFYYTENFKSRWPTPFELRLRYMLRLRIPLSDNERNWCIVNDEILSAVDETSSPAAAAGKRWTSYQFTENRFSVYYRRSFPGHRLDLDFGIMYQYWRERPGVNTFNNSINLMFDIIFRDLFGSKKKVQEG